MNANQTQPNFHQNQDTILGVHAKALNQSSTKLCSSISQLNSSAQASEEISNNLKEILKEMQESTQDLIKNLTDFKKACLTH